MNQPTAATPDTLANPGPPRIALLGQVEVMGVDDLRVEPTRRRRLTELAAIVALHPGCDHTTIDACYYPGRPVSDNTRNTQVSKLRRWLGATSTGAEYFPRHSNRGYRFATSVRTDWDDFLTLAPLDDVESASTEDLARAAALVRGRPFAGAHYQRYAWADRVKQQMIDHIIAVVVELIHRYSTARDWRAAEGVVALGLEIEPGLEYLWRARLRVLHRSGNREEVLEETISRLMALSEQYGIRLESATLKLISSLRNRGRDQQ